MTINDLPCPLCRRADGVVADRARLKPGRFWCGHCRGIFVAAEACGTDPRWDAAIEADFDATDARDSALHPRR
jgi:hypothetical protein